MKWSLKARKGSHVAGLLVCLAVVCLSQPADESLDSFCEKFTTDLSRICISVKVQTGKIVVGDLRFYASETLKRTHKPPVADPKDLAALEKFLAARVQGALDKGRPLCELQAPIDSTLCKQSGSWAEAKANFRRPPLFKQKILTIFDGIHDSSPLDLLETENDEPIDISTGRIAFRVDDPIGDICDETKYKFRVVEAGTQPIANSRQICTVLQPLTGQFWDNETVNSIVTGFYANRGLIPTLSSENEDGVRSLMILQVSDGSFFQDLTSSDG